MDDRVALLSIIPRDGKLRLGAVVHLLGWDRPRTDAAVEALVAEGYVERVVQRGRGGRDRIQRTEDALPPPFLLERVMAALTSSPDALRMSEVARTAGLCTEDTMSALRYLAATGAAEKVAGGLWVA